MRPARRHMPLVLGLMSAILLSVTAAYAAIIVSSSIVDFGAVVVGGTSTQQITVFQRGNGSTSVKVSLPTTTVGSFSTNTKHFTVSKRGGAKTVSITFTAGTTPGPIGGTVKVNGQTVQVLGDVVSATP